MTKYLSIGGGEVDNAQLLALVANMEKELAQLKKWLQA